MPLLPISYSVEPSSLPAGRASIDNFHARLDRDSFGVFGHESGSRGICCDVLPKTRDTFENWRRNTLLVLPLGPKVKH